MGISFRLVEFQNRANDADVCVRDLMAYVKLASDANADGGRSRRCASATSTWPRL